MNTRSSVPLSCCRTKGFGVNAVAVFWLSLVSSMWQVTESDSVAEVSFMADTVALIVRGSIVSRLSFWMAEVGFTADDVALSVSSST